jgi:spore photoproduct lyase
MNDEMTIEQWEYKEHTRVKHNILKKYLGAWIKILGKRFNQIIFVDGFAGRGRYYDKTTNSSVDGSPVIAINTASELLDKVRPNGEAYFAEFVCYFVEKDRNNYAQLVRSIEEERENLRKEGKEGKIQIITKNDEFAKVADEIVDYIKQKDAPSFIFIDPFGFGGVPFETVKKILELPHTEVFFTFMLQAINRFLASPYAESQLAQLYPSQEWMEVRKEANPRIREQKLLGLYKECLKDYTNVKFVLPFRVCMDERLATLYYLLHATNNFVGAKIMKDVMRSSSKSGELAWLGPKEVWYSKQPSLFDSTLPQLKEYLFNMYKGKKISLGQILNETFDLTSSTVRDYQKALEELEKEGKVVMTCKGKKGGINEKTIIYFLSGKTFKENKIDVYKPEVLCRQAKPNVYWNEYKLIDGSRRRLVSRVGDSSIIARFDKTPLPQKDTDIVCPHFLELKWAYGCPYDCAWCYLKGTFRFRPEGTSPVVKDYSKIQLHLLRFFEEAVDTPELLNTGEIADSLMHEKTEKPFSKFIIPLFESQSIHKVLFLTKSSYIYNLLELESHNQVIISFSLNAIPVAERWEKAPPVMDRIKAAKKLYEAGYEVRIRIDPIVPVENWAIYYPELLRLIFDNFLPSRITLGSLRGLQSTINGCTDRTWVRYLKESSNWGKKVDFETRYRIYSHLVKLLREKYNFENIAFCKETVMLWNALNMDYTKIKCNCVW